MLQQLFSLHKELLPILWDFQARKNYCCCLWSCVQKQGIIHPHKLGVHIRKYEDTNIFDYILNVKNAAKKGDL